jgi:hypothetical protein
MKLKNRGRSERCVVTGREKEASFVKWFPGFAPCSSDKDTMEAKALG